MARCRESIKEDFPCHPRTLSSVIQGMETGFMDQKLIERMTVEKFLTRRCAAIQCHLRSCAISASLKYNALTCTSESRLDTSRMLTLVVLCTLPAVSALLLVHMNARHTRDVQYPPGPSARPLIGSILEVSPRRAWVKMTEYKKKYGKRAILNHYIDVIDH